jgi:polyisoprenoid-binding protein YceI
MTSAVVALNSVAGYAADYKVDPSHSRVGFQIRHMVGKVGGEFKEFDGAFQFDEKAIEKSNVEFSINAASIFTNNAKRDDHLKGADFFDTSTHPKIVFKSKHVKAKGGKKFAVEGDVTLHGVTKPVTFDVEFMGADKDPWGNSKAGFVAKTTLKRKDFGIVYNKTLDSGNLLLGDDVQVELNIEADKK